MAWVLALDVAVDVHKAGLAGMVTGCDFDLLVLDEGGAPDAVAELAGEAQ